jgi:hypothetical protein
VSAAGDVITAAQYDLSVNPNGCIALRSAAQTITTGGAGTLISFDAEEFDNSAMFTPTSTSITIQNDGVYLCTCYAEWAANAVGYRGIDIVVNGVAASGLTTLNVTAAATTRVTATNQFLLTVGDVLTFSVIQNSGSSLNITARAAVTRITG